MIQTPSVARPARRQLQAFGFDPMSTRLTGRHLHLDVPYERLHPGPAGRLVHVVDYDSTRDTWYRPVNLDDPAILAQGGLRPEETNPWTHQQVVYAVATSVLERIERFSGRRFRRHADQPLVLMPHAFEGRNAFFEAERDAVLFGYYHADPRNPGPNRPGQVMFTCLSVDIVAHEVAHAVVHWLRPRFSEATNRDVLACHEAIADLVALFHHFLFPEVVSAAVARGRGDLHEGNGLLDLAAEFGLSAGRGAALRSAIMQRTPNPAQFERATEPHERGACFVAGVFDAFLMVYQRNIADLLRIATGGTGILPEGNLHPDLVARVASEAIKAADRFLCMVVRAFDFLPVVDVTFSDIVRAIVTSDRELFPDDGGQLRAILVECLRQRGVAPSGTSSLADEALDWPAPAERLVLEPDFDLGKAIEQATRDLDADIEVERPPDERMKLAAWAYEHAIQLGLDPFAAIEMPRLDVVYRLAADGQPQPRAVLHFEQRRPDLEDEAVPEELRAPLYAGTTVIAHVDGRVERIIAKPLAGRPHDTSDEGLPIWLKRIARQYRQEGYERLCAIRRWFDEVEAADPVSPWSVAPAVSRLTFARLHSCSVDGAQR